MRKILKLDYTLESLEERKKLVEQILEENPEPNESYLELMADYLILCMEKEEKKKKKILTDNRVAWMNKRETSFEGLTSQLENGEDGIYNLITEDKQIIFQPKVAITKKDLETIPFLKQIREAIDMWEMKLKKATGRDAYIIKNAIIDLRKDQYLVKDSYLRPVRTNMITRNSIPMPFDESYAFDKDGYVIPIGISLMNPKVCSMILCNYSRLKEDSYGKFDGDLYYLMMSFDEIAESTLNNYPMYKEIMIHKIDGRQNIEIQQILKEKFGTTHSVEYISSLWRKKIPGLIASAAEDKFLDWYYLEKEKGKYKKCTRCGKIKLAHNKYFSKNKTSKDKFYSICKCCRNTKDKKN